MVYGAYSTAFGVNIHEADNPNFKWVFHQQQHSNQMQPESIEINLWIGTVMKWCQRDIIIAGRNHAPWILNCLDSFAHLNWILRASIRFDPV